MDIIDAYDLNFAEGNGVKYLLRWRRKDGLQDLRKCAWYVNRLLKTETEKAEKALASQMKATLATATLPKKTRKAKK
jgi:hypothetical protein